MKDLGSFLGLKIGVKIGVCLRCIWRVLATAIFHIAIYTDSYNLYKRNRGEKGTSFFLYTFLDSLYFLGPPFLI